MSKRNFSTPSSETELGIKEDDAERLVEGAKESIQRSMNEQLQLLDLTQVTVTAMVEPSGRLGSVKGLWPKLLAAANEAATLGLVRTVVIAADQPDVPPELELVTTSPLRVLRAATLHDAIVKLYEEHGPRQAVRRHEREQCATLDLLGRPVSLADHYQTLPLLREIKRDRLLRTRKEFAKEDNSDALTSLDVLRWEEALQGEHISYESINLAHFFENSWSRQDGKSPPTPRLVVLGPPGSGKTTLLQYLGWRAATGKLRIGERRLLPARVRLRDWEAFTSTRTGADQHLPAYLTQQYAHCDPAPSLGHWRRWLQSSEVLLLLDGVDEIKGEPAFLQLVATTIDAFPESPTILTCRTVSFERHKTLCPNFPIFTLAGLDRRQRDAYIRAFPAADPTAYNPDRLIDRLHHAPQLFSLAANPLLLSIICYVADNSTAAPFPETRGQLYARAVERLLTVREQRAVTLYPGAAPASHEKLAIVQRVALQLFAHEDQQLTFSGRIVGQALKDALRAEGYGDVSGPWANALLEDLLHNSGLLRGDAQLGFFFFHLTVQEFLTAAALAQHINDNGWNAQLAVAGKTLRVSHLIDKKSWDPRWQEVIALLGGQLTDPLPLLSMLTIKKKDDIFFHRLTLAAQSFAEVRSDAHKEFLPLIDRVTSEAFAAWLRYETRGAGAAVSHLARALPALKQLNGRIENTPLLHWLRLQLRDVDADVRAGLIEACACMGESLAAEADILAELAVSLRDPDVFVRVRTTEALRRMGATTLRQPDVLIALMQAGEHDPEWFVRTSANKTLEQFKEGLLEVPEALSAFLSRQPLRLPTKETEANGRLQKPKTSSSTMRLGSTADVVATLHDPDPGKRAKAISQLKQLRAADAQRLEALPALNEIVLHDSDGGIRARAADVLGQIGDLIQEHQNVAAILITALHDRDPGVRAHAAAACGQLNLPATYRQAVLAALHEALDDTDSEARSAAADALERQMARGMRLFKRWWGKKEVRTVEELTRL